MSDQSRTYSGWSQRSRQFKVQLAEGAPAALADIQKVVEESRGSFRADPSHPLEYLDSIRDDLWALTGLVAEHCIDALQRRIEDASIDNGILVPGTYLANAQTQEVIVRFTRFKGRVSAYFQLLELLIEPAVEEALGILRRHEAWSHVLQLLDEHISEHARLTVEAVALRHGKRVKSKLYTSLRGYLTTAFSMPFSTLRGFAEVYPAVRAAHGLKSTSSIIKDRFLADSFISQLTAINSGQFLATQRVLVGCNEFCFVFLDNDSLDPRAAHYSDFCDVFRQNSSDFEYAHVNRRWLNVDMFNIFGEAEEMSTAKPLGGYVDPFSGLEIKRVPWMYKRRGCPARFDGTYRKLMEIIAKLLDNDYCWGFAAEHYGSTIAVSREVRSRDEMVGVLASMRGRQTT
jgi:hypothetical protein